MKITIVTENKMLIQKESKLTCRTHCGIWNKEDKDCEIYGSYHPLIKDCPYYAAYEKAEKNNNQEQQREEYETPENS